MDYENDLNINPDALDVESIEQPQKFMRYSKLAADAAKKADKAKEFLEVVEAEIEAEIRTKAKDNDEKTTEAVISGRVRMSDASKNARALYIDSKHELAILNSAVKAFQQRHGSIENLIYLASRNYFSTPSVPRNLSVEMKNRLSDRMDENISETKTRVRERLSRSV